MKWPCLLFLEGIGDQIWLWTLVVKLKISSALSGLFHSLVPSWLVHNSYPELCSSFIFPVTSPGKKLSECFTNTHPPTSRSVSFISSELSLLSSSITLIPSPLSATSTSTSGSLSFCWTLTSSSVLLSSISQTLQMWSKSKKVKDN